MRGTGRAAFAATLLLIVGVLNIIYGIGALDSANIFTDERRYILTNLNTLGWVLIILGMVQITGGISLFSGNTYGRVIGIIGASLGAIEPCYPSAAPTRGGRWPPSRCASTSSMASSPWARTSARWQPEPDTGCSADYQRRVHGVRLGDVPNEPSPQRRAR